MPRDGIRQPRPQHHELVLTLVLRRAICPAHRIIQPPQLALGGGVHVAHAADNPVSLVIEIQAVANQLLDIDLRRAFGTPTISAPVVTPAVFARTPFAWRTTVTLARRTTMTTLARGPGFAVPGFLFLCH